MAAKVQITGSAVVEQWIQKLPHSWHHLFLRAPPRDLNDLLQQVKRMEKFDANKLEQKRSSKNNWSTEKFKSLQVMCAPCKDFEAVLEIKGEAIAMSVQKRMPPCSHDNHEAGSCFKQLFCTACENYGHLAKSGRCKFCPLCDNVVHRPDQPCAVVQYCHAKRNEIPEEVIEQGIENTFKNHLNFKDQRN